MRGRFHYPDCPCNRYRSKSGPYLPAPHPFTCGLAQKCDIGHVDVTTKSTATDRRRARTQRATCCKSTTTMTNRCRAMPQRHRTIVAVAAWPIASSSSCSTLRLVDAPTRTEGDGPVGTAERFRRGGGVHWPCRGRELPRYRHGARPDNRGAGLVSANDFVFAAVSPGNARSLRAFLAQGFVPVASEVIITALRIKSSIPAVRWPTM